MHLAFYYRSNIPVAAGYDAPFIRNAEATRQLTNVTLRFHYRKTRIYSDSTTGSPGLDPVFKNTGSIRLGEHQWVFRRT
jgi:hypothetical protein